MGAAPCCNAGCSADAPRQGGPPLEHEARMHDFSADWFQDDSAASPRTAIRNANNDGKGEWGHDVINPAAQIKCQILQDAAPESGAEDVPLKQPEPIPIISAADTPPRAFTRKELVDIARENYTWRSNFKVAESIFVTHAECTAGLKTLEAAEDPSVTFSCMFTGDALLYYAKLDSNTPLCALNFGNGDDVGGGYKTGATAQEEDLCRQIPNLFPSLLHAQRAGFYPFGPVTCSTRAEPAKYSDVIYTPDLTVARAGIHGEYKAFCDKEWANCSLVTAAAPNINFSNDVYDLDLMYNTVRSIFLAPLLRGCQQPQSQRPVLILGAWGCGAFGCRPLDISNLFVRALQKDGLGRFYREVHFAIPPGRNADMFKETFRKHGLAFRELGGRA